MDFMEMALRASVSPDRKFRARTFYGLWAREETDAINLLLDLAGEPKEADALYNACEFHSFTPGVAGVYAKRLTWDTPMWASNAGDLLDRLSEYLQPKIKGRQSRATN